MQVIVYCYAIHFMIFPCSVLYTSYVSQAPSPTCSHVGSANGRHWWEIGMWEEERSQGVFSLLLDLGSIFNSMVESPLWFLLLLAAPSQMVLVLAWQPPSGHSLLVLQVRRALKYCSVDFFQHCKTSTFCCFSWHSLRLDCLFWVSDHLLRFGYCMINNLLHRFCVLLLWLESDIIFYVNNLSGN